MSKELRQLVAGSEEFKMVLKKFLSMYEEAADNTDASLLSIEERSNFNVLYEVQDKIIDAYRLLEYLDKPVKSEGRLEKLSNGRYSVNGFELSSGSYVEYFSDDEDGGSFVPSRLEHNGHDYYIVSLGKDKSIEDLKIKIK